MGLVLIRTTEVKRNKEKSFANFQGIKMSAVTTLKAYIGRDVTLRKMREPRAPECMERLEAKPG